MTSRDMLTLAKQGDPQVIAVLLNHAISPKGIKAQVVRRDQCLHVLLESARALNQEAVVAFIETSIKTLQVQPISTLRVYGRQVGQKSFAWDQEIQLTWDYVAPNPAANPMASDSDPSPFALTARADTQATQSPDPVSPVSTLESPHLTPSPTSSSAAESSPSPPTLPNPERLAAENPLPVEQPLPLGVSTDGTPPNLLELPLKSDLLQDAEPQSTEIPDLFRRPEAVILLIFVSVIMLWQMYLDLLEAAEPDEPLSARELARRLGVNTSTINRRKDRINFPAWTQDLDPDGVAWVYDDGFFVPQDELGAIE